MYKLNPWPHPLSNIRRLGCVGKEARVDEYLVLFTYQIHKNYNGHSKNNHTGCCHTQSSKLYTKYHIGSCLHMYDYDFVGFVLMNST